MKPLFDATLRLGETAEYHGRRGCVVRLAPLTIRLPSGRLVRVPEGHVASYVPSDDDIRRRARLVRAMREHP
jgi:hypothetical protein